MYFNASCKTGGEVEVTRAINLANGMSEVFNWISLYSVMIVKMHVQ
jgi:hypothetical protein